MAKYHTLLVLDTEDDIWLNEFGDFSKAVVKEELQDFRDHGVMRKHLAIITTDEGQEEIQEGVLMFNADYINKKFIGETK